ncbi:MAG TPA: acetolactate synthase large subunit, partial [Candidatus Omnitrophota bacterium]|nr:acetolactate synthase large subunit [Candidatus Omnitrophota bacterium]
VFGLPGEEIEDLLFSLQKSSIKFIPTRHEQGAAFMADVWGRLSGKAGVCLSTLGPGATNLATGIADANLDKSPVVAITGQAGLHRVHNESHQYVDVLSLLRPITKWSASITNPEVVPEVVRKAFKIAESEKPGAAHIELPEDVANMSSKARPLRVLAVRRPDPDTKALQEALVLLKKAKRPLIIAGNGAVRKSFSEKITAFVEKHNIPLVNTFMGQGALPDRNPRSLFSIGLGFRDIVMEAVESADVVITAGYDLAEYSPDRWNPKKDKVIIHIDFLPAEVYAHYQTRVEIVADIGATFGALDALLDKEGLVFNGAWFAPVREQILKDVHSYSLRNRGPFTIPGALNVLRSVMADEDLLISDVGSHKMWIARNFPVHCPNGCLISNGLASMGFALPGAIAASLYEPGRRIVAAMGDGGFMMNSQELETAKRLGVSFTTIIFNDNDYGLISWKQRMGRGRTTGTKIGNPDFKKYAESFGIKGYRPKNLSQLKSQLKKAVHSGGLSVVEIPVDTSVNLKLIKKLKDLRTRRHR